MSEVLFLHPPRNTKQPSFTTIPMGVFGIVNLLKRRGVDVRGVNIPLERQLDERFSMSELQAQISPRVVLIDLHWYEHSCGAVEVAQHCKMIWPDCLLVLGGLTATIFAEEILRDYDAIDYVVRGEGELPCLQLVEALTARSSRDFSEIPSISFRSNVAAGEVVSTSGVFSKRLSNLDFDYADFSWLDNHHAYLHSTPEGVWAPKSNFWLLIAMGCPFNCSYCGGARDSFKKTLGYSGLWKRDPTRVASDVEWLCRNSVEVVNLSHDPWILGKAFWGRLFKQLADGRSKPRFYIEVFQMPDFDFLDSLSTCVDIPDTTLVFSPLVGDERVRRLNGKLYSNDELLSIVQYARKIGFKIELAFSRNLPGVTAAVTKSTQELIDRVESIAPDVPSYCQEISLDPHSAIALDPGKHGANIAFSTFRDYVIYSSGQSAGNEEVVRNGFSIQEPVL